MRPNEPHRPSGPGNELNQTATNDEDQIQLAAAKHETPPPAPWQAGGQHVLAALIVGAVLIGLVVWFEVAVFG